MNAPLELIERASLDVQPPAAAPQHQLTAIEHAMRNGATPEQMVAAMQLQVQMDNHRLEMMREKRRMDEEDRQVAAKSAYYAAMAQFKRNRGR